MCTPKSTGLVSMPVSSESTTYQTALRSDWMLAFGTDKLRGVVHVVGSSNLEVKMEYITASVKASDPDTVSSLGGSTITADGYMTNNVALTFTAKDNLLVQVVAQIRSTTSGTLAQGLVSLRAWAHSEANVISTRTLELGPTEIVSGTKNYNYLPLAAPQPMVGLSEIMFAVVYTVGSGTVYYQPVYRTFANDLDNPSTWAVVSSTTEQSASSNTTYNPGALTLADDTTKTHWQPGIRWSSNTGAGTVNVTVASQY